MKTSDLTTAEPAGGSFAVSSPGIHAVGYTATTWGGATAVLHYVPKPGAETPVLLPVTNASFTADGVKMLDLGIGAYEWKLTVGGTAHVGEGFVSD